MNHENLKRTICQRLRSLLWLLAPCSMLLAPCLCHAQYRSLSYTHLKGGWNSIHVPGDASYQAIEAHFPTGGPGAVIEEIWRWNPNPDQVQFMSSSLVPAEGTPEWSVWRRGENANTLSSLTQGAYLVKCSGPGTTTHPAVTLKMAVRLPDNSWVRNGANLFGFPSQLSVSYPLFRQYFASFPSAIATGTRIYRYVGGELGSSNPIQIFSTAQERVDATQAYWFSAETVGTFSALLEVSLSTGEAIDFGRTSSEIVMYLKNNTSAATTAYILRQASADYPTGFGVRAEATNNVGLTAGMVPLTRRTLDAGTGLWVDSLITGTFAQSVPAQSTVELRFGIQRSAMTASSTATPYSHALRVSDELDLCDVWVPVRALKTDLSGLWMGEALVSEVESKAQGNSITPVSRPFPLRWLVHVDSSGTARLLSQVYVGRLAAGGASAGICTKESGLLVADLKNARRLSAAHLPLDSVTACTGTLAVPSTLTASISTAKSDATNPFTHKYHPDHKADEAYDVTRQISFQFTAVPPEEARVFTIAGGTNAGLAVGMVVDFYVNSNFASKGFITELRGTNQFVVDRVIPRNGVLSASIFSGPNNDFVATHNSAALSPSKPGWGSTVIGGTYSEAIHGIHRDATANGGDGVRVQGTFELRRVSELGSLTINP
jgi:hypothetical protein